MGGRRKSKLIPEAMAQIQRLPGETDEEWARRYNRERRRAYRALIPKGPRRLRGPDLTLRANAAPPEVRAALECLPGESEKDRKRRYQRLLVKHWRSQNKERDAGNRRALQRQPKHKEKAAEWLARNPGKNEEYQRRYFQENKEKRISALQEWRARNPDRIREVTREWFAKHPGYMAAQLTKYRDRAVQATPPWMWKLHGREIEKIYRQCAKVSEATGIPHHVDHIYPLAGKTSCGLHVPWNLQIIPAVLNGRKHNKSPEDFGANTEKIE